MEDALKPLTTVHNRFAVGSHGNGVVILAPLPRYTREEALNLIAWIAVIHSISPDEFSGALKQVEGT